MLWREMQAPRRAQTSPLATAYGQLLRAAASGDVAGVDSLLQGLFGLRSPPASAPATAPRVREMLRYRGFKPAELAMLAADIKPVVKFEDIPVRQAAAFVDRFATSYTLSRSHAYLKDGLLLRSRPCATNHPDALQTIYASRGDASLALQRLEEADPEDIRGAGALLGIPACCAAAFADDFDRSRSDQDTLNDDACIRMLYTAAAGTDAAAMCPLSDAELLGFYPCRVDCPQARARAAVVLHALDVHQPGSADATLASLAGTYLFWRLPFFARLPGGTDDDGWTSTDGFEINLFGHRSVRAAQLRFASLLSAALTSVRAVRVAVGPGGSVELLGRDADGEERVLAADDAASLGAGSSSTAPRTAPMLAHFQHSSAASTT